MGKEQNLKRKPGPGRPKGLKNKTTVMSGDIRQWGFNALQKAGGEEYLYNMLTSDNLSNQQTALKVIFGSLTKEISAELKGGLKINVIKRFVRGEDDRDPS